MGHSQTSAQSLQSIAGDRETGELRESIEKGHWNCANPIINHQTSDSIALDFRSERKISFVLHEPDNESEGSSKSTVTIQGEDGAFERDKKKVQPQTGRPFLLRRGTAGNTGSFKRRSLKLRRGTKEGKDMECEACKFCHCCCSRVVKIKCAIIFFICYTIIHRFNVFIIIRFNGFIIIRYSSAHFIFLPLAYLQPIAVDVSRTLTFVI